LTCPVHRAIWADKRPLDREVERIAGTLDGDLHLHHAGGQCEPINPVDLVGHVLNQAGLVVGSGHDEQTENCPRCGGTGEVDAPSPSNMVQLHDTCGLCGGSGYRPPPPTYVPVAAVVEWLEAELPAFHSLRPGSGCAGEGRHGMTENALPPESAEAEVGVIGAVLLAPTALAAATQEVRLRPDHFYRERHRVTWRAVLQVGAAGDPIDPLTVCEQLRQQGELDEAGGQAYVYSLPNLVPSASHVRKYARIVHDKAVWRARFDAGRQIAAAALDEDEDLFHQAEAGLVHSDEAAGRTSTPEDLAAAPVRPVGGAGRRRRSRGRSRGSTS
jgi:hypothetical protein